MLHLVLQAVSADTKPSPAVETKSLILCVIKPKVQLAFMLYSQVGGDKNAVIVQQAVD